MIVYKLGSKYYTIYIILYKPSHIYLVACFATMNNFDNCIVVAICFQRFEMRQWRRVIRARSQLCCKACVIF